MDRILILTERGAEAEALEDTLRRAGYETHVVDTVEAARSELATSKVNLTIVDLDLHALRRARGLDLARELRTAYPATRVMLTSTSCLTQRQLERTDCGAVAFLPKPFDVARAPTLVQKCLTCCCDGVRRLWHAQGAASVPSSYAM